MKFTLILRHAVRIPHERHRLPFFWMSALGQKQTFAVQEALSAFTPKADISAAQINVR
jgi:hypothetical protein